jgi:hypothetical protein
LSFASDCIHRSCASFFAIPSPLLTLPELGGPVRVLRVERRASLPRRPKLLHDRRQLPLSLNRALADLLLRVPLSLLQPLQPGQLRQPRQLLRERRRGRVLAEQRRQRGRAGREPRVACRLALRRESLPLPARAPAPDDPCNLDNLEASCEARSLPPPVSACLSEASTAACCCSAPE